MDYEIICLGHNCQPRTYLTNYELLPSKKHGRKSMVFDLAIHPTKSITEFLKNHFFDYIQNFEYGFYKPFGLNYWHIKKYNVVFNHDSDCKKDDYEKIKNRYINRLENFKNAVNTDKFVFFIHNIDENATIEDINNLYSAIQTLRGEKPFKLIVWDMFEKFETDEINENITIHQLLHPYKDFSDWYQTDKQNAVSKLWQKTYIDYLKTEIIASGFGVKYYKKSATEKLKPILKPLLKNIFTVTNDAELGAKVLILFGKKFKIKKLK